MLYSTNCFRIEPAYRVTKVRFDTNEVYIDFNRTTGNTVVTFSTDTDCGISANLCGA